MFISFQSIHIVEISGGGDMEVSPEVYKRYMIERALRRSYVKRKIVMYLFTNGFGYISQIARNISVTPTNVIGAIRGMENRYTLDGSLLSLGVVVETEINKDDTVKMFCLTSLLGQDAVITCKKLEKELHG